jgi:serine/threonine-protein kinase
MDTRPVSAQMIGTVLSERYRLEAKLGSGGMSTVYLARDETLDRAVAVKVMHREMSEQEDQLRRFRQEARAVAKLSHPNVVAVIDAGEDGGHPYIVFEYVEGETLKQRISRLGALDVQDAIAYSIEVARGLSVAHSRQMVHRDVKPQNVLIDVEGRAKLTDFGISRELEKDGLTATGRVLGTTDYVAPEQAMGRGVDPRSDIYSLGVVLYEMLTGDVPFHADSQVGVAMKHVHEELPDVQRRRPEVSAAVALVVERATAKDAAERYQRIEEMTDDLETALEVEAARAGTTSGEATSVLEAVPPPRRKLSSRARWSWAGIIALLLVAGGTLLAVQLISSGKVGGGGGGQSGAKIPIDSATDFDPEGDLSEHPDDVGFAFDGNPTGTAWTTETYETDDFGKDGVGIYFDTGRPHAADTLDLRTPDPGWGLKVYAADDPPPQDLSGWTEVGSAGKVEGRQQVDLDTGGRRFRYYLVWASSPTELSGGYGASVSDVRLFG